MVIYYTLYIINHRSKRFIFIQTTTTVYTLYYIMLGILHRFARSTLANANNFIMYRLKEN